MIIIILFDIDIAIAVLVDVNKFSLFTWPKFIPVQAQVYNNRVTGNGAHFSSYFYKLLRKNLIIRLGALENCADVNPLSLLILDFQFD